MGGRLCLVVFVRRFAAREDRDGRRGRGEENTVACATIKGKT